MRGARAPPKSRGAAEAGASGTSTGASVPRGCLVAGQGQGAQERETRRVPPALPRETIHTRGLGHVGVSAKDGVSASHARHACQDVQARGGAGAAWNRQGTSMHLRRVRASFRAGEKGRLGMAPASIARGCIAMSRFAAVVLAWILPTALGPGCSGTVTERRCS